MTLPEPPQPQQSMDHARAVVLAVCNIAGSKHLIEHARAGLTSAGVLRAVKDHDDGILFEWLMRAVSFQGIGDAVASSYMDEHGSVEARRIRENLADQPPCPKLTGYWAFEGCRFHKGSRTCAEPEHMAGCPLPRHDLRNGRLNQTAYSVFLFMRDVAQGDFVGWIDDQLQGATQGEENGRAARLRNSLLMPLGHVHGVSSKVLSMSLADLLLGAGSGRALWQEAGAGMIAVDTLVHNWLHRSGILQSMGAEHPYGAACYGPNGCAELIEQLSATIEARVFNPEYPANFPRFVQKAIWWFCAQLGHNECNGNRVDDAAMCARDDCSLRTRCGRVALRSAP